MRREMILLLICLLISASVSAYSGSESGFHIKLVTPQEFSDTSTEDGYKMAFIVNPETSGFLRTEGNYKLGLNLYQSGVGGGYSEDGFKLYLVPDQAFISYSCDITANDPICGPMPYPAPLNLTKTDDVSGCADVGDTITYTICYDNQPNSAAVHNVVITDTLPAGVNFASASHDGIYNSSTRTVTWNIGNLAAGAAEACVTLEVVAYAGTWGTTLENCAIIDSDDTNPTEAREETVVCEREPRPPVPVPAFTPPGITALIGLLSLAGFVMLRRRE